VIGLLWESLRGVWEFFATNFDPIRDTVDILLITIAIYWLLLLIRGTRAVQMLVGLIVLIALSLASEVFQLATLGLVLENFFGSAVIILVILFQNDIRRALARMGRGIFPSVSAAQESQVLEEVVKAAQALAHKRTGALIVIERETALGDQIEAGTELDSTVSKDLFSSIFHTSSPLHDGAVVIQDGRMAFAGCILPLTLRDDLPEGVGTRHRAAVGITEETDAVVIVVSEETGTISVVMSGEMIQGLDAPRLRVLLHDIMGGDRRGLPSASEITRPLEVADDGTTGADSSKVRSVR